MTPPAQGAVNAAVYCRLSLARFGDTTNIEEQERTCRELARQRGWDVFQVYPDNSKSAWQRNRKRPGWDKMLADVEAGKISAIIVYHGDRLVRQPFDLETLINLAYGKGIMLASPTGTRDLGNDDDLFILRIEVAAQCRASADTSRRVKRRNAIRRQAGLTRGGGTGGRTLGFETDGVTHRPGEAEMMREATARLLAGETMRSILADLTARGLRSTAGNIIRQSSFTRTLLLPRMAGLMPDGEQKAAWEPVLGRAEWESLRAVMASHPSNDWSGRGALYLLSGIALCGNCGHLMHSADRRSAEYRCPYGGCGRNRRDRRLLDAYVIAAVCAQLSRSDNPESRRMPTTALAAEFRVLAGQRAETEAAITDPAQGGRLPLLLARLDAIDRRLGELRELAGGHARSRLLSAHAGITPAEFRALPLGTQRSLVAGALTVRVMPVSRRGPGFNPDDVILTTRR